MAVFSHCYGIFRFFLFSMSERVFEAEPECLNCFVTMIELCYDYRCKALRHEWMTVIVKSIIFILLSVKLVFQFRQNAL